ncbi:MAG TPA: AsmA-like C-terminal region-containing protein, partial [Pirellula sp.]|nr:AsmA-like C-terminal region-containing protein [Pirellula sp.]
AIPIDATGSFDVQGDTTNWLASGSADLKNVKLILGERPIDIETAVLNILPDAFRIERFKLSDPIGRIAGSALIQRLNEGEHLLNLRLVDIEFARYLDTFATPVLQGVKGLASLDVRLRKAATETDLMSGWQGKLTGMLSDLQYRSMPVGELGVTASLVDETLHLEVDGEVLGGSAHAIMDLPNLSESVQSFPRLPAKLLDENEFVGLEMSLHRIQLSQLLSFYYGQQSGAGVEGVASLDVRLRKAATETDLMSGWRGKLTGMLSDLQYRSMPVGELGVTASLGDETLHLEVDGEVLGGSAHAIMDLPNLSESVQSFPRLAAKLLDENEFVSIEVSLRRIQLRQLLSLYYGQQTGAGFEGVASFDFSNVRSQGDKGWSGRLDLPSLYFERHSLAQNLILHASYLNGILTIDKLVGGFAGGRIEATGELQLASSMIGGMAHFHAEKLQLGSLVALFYPKYSSHYKGNLTYRGRLQSDRHILLSGHARLINANVYDLPIEDAHGDLKVIFSQLGSLHAIESSSVTGTALGGRLDARVKIRGGARYELNTSVKIDDGRLDELSRSLGFQRILGTGKFNATARIHSDNFFDLGSLTGPLRFRFERADAQSAPLISDLARLAPLTQFASTDIQYGTMDAQLGQGQARIRHFLIYSDAFTLAAQGYAGLASRRLDLDAILQNGGGIEQQLTQSATQKLLSLSLPQLFIFSEINDLIRNRAVYFHVGGTTQHPSIQPRPISTLAKALIQNIERELFIPPLQNTILPGY